MFEFAILTGIFSYLIFFLGLFGLLYKSYLITFFIIYLICLFLILTKKIFQCFIFVKLYLNKNYIFFTWLKIIKNNLQFAWENKITSLFIILIILQQLINLIGVFGPELSFDALWYHLTLPKIFLLYHKIFYIKGGLFYYSVMPKLIEMIYLACLALGSEIYAKLFHFLFGLLTLFIIYKIGRLYLSKKNSIIACVIFTSSLVFNWLQITSYIDLARTFFESLSFYFLLKYINVYPEKKISNKLLDNDLIKSSILIGLAITTKLISILDLIGINLFLIIYFSKMRSLFPRSLSFPNKFKIITIKIFIYNLIAFLISLPWFIFAFVNTRNIFYPIFSDYKINYSLNILNPIYFLKITWNIFTKSQDPLSPIFLFFLPVILIKIKNFKRGFFYLLLFSFLIYLSWYLTPLTGGGRFILPFLSIFSVICALTLSFIKDKYEKFILLFAIFLSILVSIIFRFGANEKYLPVLIGNEKKSVFLTKNLNFNSGDFYDIDNFFKKNIKKRDKVLLINFHNEYYVDFPFIDKSYLNQNDYFNYVAVQNENLPLKYKNYKLIYENNLTNVKLYKK